MKTKTSPTTNSIKLSPLRRSLLLSALAIALAWFALSPAARAVCEEGCDDSHANTFLGFNALFSNTTGTDNTATGFGALQSNSTGFSNTANGINALSSNTTGVDNTANGDGALFSNTTGFNSTANGLQALYSNTAGSYNTASGLNALFNNTTGGSNTANGLQALYYNTTGNNNTANGFNALFNNTGSNNIGLGFNAGQNLTTGSNNIDIGNAGVARESRRIRIGTAGSQTKTFIAGISGATVPNGVGVIVGSNGQLGTVVSSERFKDNIKPMEKASEAIHALKPVTFRYKQELDPDGIPQFGLVAEEVERVNPGLIVRDADGKPYTVRYEAVNAMLLNEFLKEHKKGQQQDRKIAELEATVAEQEKQIKVLMAGLQQVSDQMELSRPAPRIVKNDH